jgi:uncharacterized protein (DUF1778 family)
MTEKSEKTITIRITKDEHKMIKSAALDNDLSIKDYLLQLVKNDTKK